MDINECIVKYEKTVDYLNDGLDQGFINKVFYDSLILEAKETLNSNIRDSQERTMNKDISKRGKGGEDKSTALNMLVRATMDAFHKESVGGYKFTHSNSMNIIIELSGGKCLGCGDVLYVKGSDGKYERSSVPSNADHIAPPVLGGTTSPGNVMPICIPCNNSKSNSDYLDFYAGNSEAFAIIDRFLSIVGYEPLPEGIYDKLFEHYLESTEKAENIIREFLGR